MCIKAVNSVYFGQASQNIYIFASPFHLLHSYFIQYIYYNQMLCQCTVPGGGCDWLNLKLAVLWLASSRLTVICMLVRWMAHVARPLLDLCHSLSLAPSIRPFIHLFSLSTHHSVLLQYFVSTCTVKLSCFNYLSEENNDGFSAQRMCLISHYSEKSLL